VSDIRDKLKGLLANKGVMSGTQWKDKLDDLAERRASGECEVGTVAPGEVVGDDEFSFYLVREDFPLDTQQGNVTLGSVLDTKSQHIALSAADEELQEFDPTKAAFVDTETTGLMGGTGTVAFLVGVGYFHEGAFRLDQCFMRDFDDEEPMLEYLEGIFKRCESVVSYNGKSFDLPLLRSRFIQNRIPFRPDAALHFDLLHTARRFWKSRLRDCSLGNIEREILGVNRTNDVNSAEIPRLWLDYLRSRDARPLERVFYHHKIDILSLVALTAWVSQCLDVPDGGGFEHTQDRVSLLHVLMRQRKFKEAIVHANELLKQERSALVRRETLSAMALAHKKLQQWMPMADAWERVLEEIPSDMSARIELAKFHEHRSKNLGTAERVCTETIQLIETRGALGTQSTLDAQYLGEFQHRLTRIRRKITRTGRRATG
jgi:hypothetical protein